MKRILTLLVALILSLIVLVSCSDDKKAVRDYAGELNRRANSSFAELREIGIDVKFEARETSLAVIILPDDVIINTTSSEYYPDIVKDLSSMMPKETLGRECPEVSSVIVEIRNNEGKTVYTQEIE